LSGLQNPQLGVDNMEARISRTSISSVESGEQTSQKEGRIAELERMAGQLTM
jgi:hypothetical protein